MLGVGGHLLPGCLLIVDGFCFRAITSQGRQATWVHKFQFISPIATAVVGSTHFGRPAGPNQTLNPGGSLCPGVLCASRSKGLKPEPVLTQKDAQTTAYSHHLC